MEIIHNLNSFSSTQRTSLTIGNFDGFHKGHQLVVDKIIECSKKKLDHSVLISFNPHPLKVLNPNDAPILITPLKDKITLLRKTSLNTLVLLKFDKDLSRISPETFVKDILVKRFNVRDLFIGNNFSFGYQRSGNLTLLQKLSKSLNFSVHTLPEVLVKGCRVSSSHIRDLVQSGKITSANRFLGRPYSLNGSIISGDGLGEKHLLPTLNLKPFGELIPQTGVYITKTVFERKVWPSITNVGMRPTLAGQGLRIETHILDENIVQAPKIIKISFLYRLRDEQSFQSLSDLKKQMVKDCGRARRFFDLFNLSLRAIQ